MRRVLMTTLVLTALGGLGPAHAGTKDTKPAKKAPSSPYSKAILAFCDRNLNRKVGSGECAHLIVEALRVAGAEFASAKFGDHPNPGDYVWGTLVKYLSVIDGKVVDSNPATPCQAGDVIQSRDAVFKGGKNAPHHTAVVAAVDDQGRPTMVYEQNSGRPKKRLVTKGAVDLLSLTGGWARIYRPSKPKPNPRLPVEFTVVNRTDEPVTFTVGRNAFTLTAQDTEQAFVTYRSSPAPLVVAATSYPVRHRRAYEIYKKKNGRISLREVK
jgi:hypothetical protein